MLIDKPVKYLTLFILTYLVLTGCGTSKAQSIPTPTALASGGEPDQIQLSCPEEDTLFNLWFSHYTVLQIDAGDGETFHLEEVNIPP